MHCLRRLEVQLRSHTEEEEEDGENRGLADFRIYR